MPERNMLSIIWIHRQELAQKVKLIYQLATIIVITKTIILIGKINDF